MKNLLPFFLWCYVGLFSIGVEAQLSNRWRLEEDGSINWSPQNKETHQDHIEMSGKTVSVVFRYGVENGKFVLNKSMVWPQLRVIPNDTYGSLMRRYNWNLLDMVTVNGRAFTEEQVLTVILKGLLKVESFFNQGRKGKWKLIREYFPSTELPALVECYTLINEGKNELTVELPRVNQKSYTNPQKGVLGSYCIETKTDKDGYYTISSGDTLRFSSFIIAYLKDQVCPQLDALREKELREMLVHKLMNNLVLETPDSIIDRMFAFSKIRGCESIYETKGGPMHGPGGESYYAALWANDQAEYINPFFPFVGYNYGNASALNSYKHFARFMNDEWKPIPSSIIAEGLDIWNGAGDRGDAAMIAYGAARYVLARGIKEEAQELWPLIEWCLEYCRRQLNEEGVVTSDSDELEGRFPAGDANLCTSSLYYDALLSASYLCRELNIPKSSTYRKQAELLRKKMESYFGAKVEGYETYAYYKGNDILRSWICIPLTVGIDERAEGTIAALFSSRLWTKDGLLTQAGSKTFWDRSTLYALRGAYSVGATEKATEFLKRYSSTRLLGDHVPYAIEAWPEGSQRHLSAESGLYGRIITEGLFGIRPTGFKSFMLTPRLPQNWKYMNLRHIHAFDSCFDIEVKRMEDGKLEVCVISKEKQKKYRIKDGAVLTIKL
ncbi:MAG: hypothetical protein IJD84_09260 [Parabacteroides sp.]|nr:hypothetical protein [Parabacteroides sp.]